MDYIGAVIAGRKTVTADTVDDDDRPYGDHGDYDLKQRLGCLVEVVLP